MSQFSLSFDSSSDASLLVRDAHGQYQVATPEQILLAARHVVDQKLQRGAAFTSPAVVKDYLCGKLGGFDHEVFSVLLLDSQNRLIEYVEMFQGTISQASVYPREVVKLALKHNAAAMILSHCHPSGCVQPSRADEVLTRQLTEALKLVDVRVLDHIIVGATQRSRWPSTG